MVFFLIFASASKRPRNPPTFGRFFDAFWVGSPWWGNASWLQMSPGDIRVSSGRASGTDGPAACNGSRCSIRMVFFSDAGNFDSTLADADHIWWCVPHHPLTCGQISVFFIRICPAGILKNPVWLPKHSSSFFFNYHDRPKKKHGHPNSHDRPKGWYGQYRTHGSHPTQSQWPLDDSLELNLQGAQMDGMWPRSRLKDGMGRFLFLHILEINTHQLNNLSIFTPG